jgi:hypothetical protein
MLPPSSGLYSTTTLNEVFFFFFFFFFLYPFCPYSVVGFASFRGSRYFLESLYTPGRWLAKLWRPVTSGNWTPNIYIPSGARAAQLIPPRHWVLILVAFYDTHELRWGYSLLPATTRE